MSKHFRPAQIDFDERLDCVRMTVKGSLDSRSTGLFSKIIQDFDGDPRSVELDLEEATYIDSAALGLLLLLRKDGDRKVQIIAISDDVRQPMITARFDSLLELPATGA